MEADQMNESITALRGRIATLQDLSEQLEIARQNGGDVGPIAEKLSAEISGFTLGNK